MRSPLKLNVWRAHWPNKISGIPDQPDRITGKPALENKLPPNIIRMDWIRWPITCRLTARKLMEKFTWMFGKYDRKQQRNGERFIHFGIQFNGFENLYTCSSRQMGIINWITKSFLREYAFVVATVDSPWHYQEWNLIGGMVWPRTTGKIILTENQDTRLGYINHR